MMHDIGSYLGIFIMGLLLGAFFFGGLLWTVKKAPQSDKPGLRYAISFVLRCVLTLVAFYVVMTLSLVYLLVCLLGFSIMRYGIIKYASGERYAS